LRVMQEKTRAGQLPNTAHSGARWTFTPVRAPCSQTHLNISGLYLKALVGNQTKESVRHLFWDILTGYNAPSLPSNAMQAQ